MALLSEWDQCYPTPPLTRMIVGLPFIGQFTLRREDLKSSFVSTVRPTVHTNPSRKRSFLNTLFKLEEFENASFSFSSGRKTFSRRHFAKTMTSWQSRDFLKHKSKITVIVAFLNSSGVVWTENMWSVFRVKSQFSKSSGICINNSKGSHSMQVLKNIPNSTVTKVRRAFGGSFYPKTGAILFTVMFIDLGEPNNHMTRLLIS